MNERIKELRKTLSLTMEELGEKLGVTRSAISNIESGKRGITEQMVLAICREFEVNENWLRNGAGEMFQPIPKNGLEMLAKEHNLNQFEYLVIEEYLNLPDENRKAVLDFVMELFAKFSETRVALEHPAVIKADPNYPETMFKEAPDSKEMQELSDEEKVELYRQELKREREAREKSGA